MKLLAAFLTGLTLGLTAHLALGYLWPPTLEIRTRRAVKQGLADLAAGRVRPWSEIRWDDGYGLFV